MFALLLMLASVGQPAVPSSPSPGSDPGSARWSVPSTLRAGEMRWYPFTLSARSDVTVATSGSFATVLVLHDGPIELSRAEGSPADPDARIARPLDPGPYRIGVRLHDPTRAGRTRLDFAAVPAADDDPPVPAPTPTPPIPPLPPTPAPAPDARSTIFGLLNAARGRIGVAPYTRDDRLDVAAQSHAEAMAAGRESYGHGGFPDRLYAAGYPRSASLSEGCFILDPSTGFDIPYWIAFLETHPTEAHGRDFRNPRYTRIGIGHDSGTAGEFMVFDYGSTPPSASAPAPVPPARVAATPAPQAEPVTPAAVAAPVQAQVQVPAGYYYPAQVPTYYATVPAYSGSYYYAAPAAPVRRGLFGFRRSYRTLFAAPGAGACAGGSCSAN